MNPVSTEWEQLIHGCQRTCHQLYESTSDPEND